jgi:phosphate transport system substrate-binding protein
VHDVLRATALLAIAAGSIIALGLTACGGDDTAGSTSANLSGEIAGAGSTAQEPAQKAWIASFEDTHADVTTSYAAVGSGDGRERFIAGGVDYASSDAPLSIDEFQAAAKQCGGAENLVHIPVFASAIAIVYNLRGVDSLQLSPDAIAGIFNRRITTWNDPAITKDNPGVDLPDTPITPVTRSGESGTSFNLADYLAKAAPSSWPYPPDDTWPVKDGESAEGTSGVVHAVGAKDGTIGYADAGQSGDLGIAKVKVGSDYIEPTAEGVANDVEASRLAAQVGDAPYVFVYEVERTSHDPSDYPLVLVSYGLTCTSADNADVVGPFFAYIDSADGQQTAADSAGSSPLIDNVLEQVQPAIDAIGSG